MCGLHVNVSKHIHVSEDVYCFTGANLKAANFDNSQMNGVNLRLASLRGSSLRYCNLRYAIMAGTDMEVRMTHTVCNPGHSQFWEYPEDVI